MEAKVEKSNKDIWSRVETAKQRMAELKSTSGIRFYGYRVLAHARCRLVEVLSKNPSCTAQELEVVEVRPKVALKQIQEVKGTVNNKHDKHCLSSLEEEIKAFTRDVEARLEKHREELEKQQSANNMNMRVLDKLVASAEEQLKSSSAKLDELVNKAKTGLTSCEASLHSQLQSNPHRGAIDLKFKPIVDEFNIAARILEEEGSPNVAVLKPKLQDSHPDVWSRVSSLDQEMKDLVLIASALVFGYRNLASMRYRLKAIITNRNNVRSMISKIEDRYRGAFNEIKKVRDAAAKRGKHQALSTLEEEIKSFASDAEKQLKKACDEHDERQERAGRGRSKRERDVWECDFRLNTLE